MWPVYVRDITNVLYTTIDKWQGGFPNYYRVKLLVPVNPLYDIKEVLVATIKKEIK